jgi:hypothetical protein
MMVFISFVYCSSKDFSFSIHQFFFFGAKQMLSTTSDLRRTGICKNVRFSQLLGQLCMQIY